AKLLVPAGAPLHDSAGEMLLPVQPMTAATCAFGTVLPSWISGLVSLNDFCAPALESAANVAMRAMRDFIRGLRCEGLWVSGLRSFRGHSEGETKLANWEDPNPTYWVPRRIHQSHAQSHGWTSQRHQCVVSWWRLGISLLQVTRALVAIDL